MSEREREREREREGEWVSVSVECVCFLTLKCLVSAQCLLQRLCHRGAERLQKDNRWNVRLTTRSAATYVTCQLNSCTAKVSFDHHRFECFNLCTTLLFYNCVNV